MRKKVVHNFNLSIKNSTDIKSSEELTKTIIKELAKVSQEMTQQKDIVQLWQEQKSQNAAVVDNNSISLIEGGATDNTATSEKRTSVSNTPSASGETINGAIPSGTISNPNALIGGVADNTSGTSTSATSSNTTSPTSGAESNVLNFSNGTTTQTYANVAAQQTVTVPQIFHTSENEPTTGVVKAEIKKKLDAAIAANDNETINYWTNISKAFDEGATAKDFDGKPNNILFTQMYARLKQSNTSVESQNFNWEIVRKKMIASIDANILKGKISPESKKRWTTIKQQLIDDKVNIANLFEQYDELFLLLKDVEGLDTLPNTITITTKTKIYPNLSADKLYAPIGKKDVYVFLKSINDMRGSAVNKGAVKIKNSDKTLFIMGESLEFMLDEIFINQNAFKKENINWVVYNVDNNKKVVFRDKGTSLSYNFDTAGTYRVEAYGKDDTVNNKNASTFIELKIVPQEIIITPPAIIKSKFIRTLAEGQSFKITLKNSEVKTLNPIKLYYQVENTKNKKSTIILGEQELDPTGIIKFSMENLGEYCIKVISKDQYNLTQKHSITVIKNFVDSIEKVNDNTENDVYFCSKTSRNAIFKVKNFKIEPATPQEKENVKWLIYDKNGNIHIPDGLKLQVENNDVESPYLLKGESFVFPIPKVEGEFTVEAYSNIKDGIESTSSKKIYVKYPQVTEAYWAYKNGNKKKTSGFAGEINYIKASIPGYSNKLVRINFFLNDSKVVNYHSETKTNEKGEVNKILKFNADLQKHFGIQKSKTAKIRFEIEGRNGRDSYPFKKSANVYNEAELNVTTGAKITDIYFKYEDKRVTPFTKLPYGSKVTGVVRTLNMVGKEVTLRIFKDAHHPKYSHKTVVNNEGVAAINFILDKKWYEINPLLGTMDMFYLGMEGIVSKLSLENGLNAFVKDIITSENKTNEKNKYGIDIPYFLTKYKGNYETNLKVLLNDMNEYYVLEKIVPQKEQVAYMLATVFTETFKTFKPVIESFWIKNKKNREASYHRYDPILASTEKRKKAAIANGNAKEGDGVKYCGRGYVQLTWKKNYQKVKDQFGIDVVNYPDKALEPKLAAKIMIWGMNNGIFTGVSINRYINDSKTDYVNARRVINGTDRSRAIAADAKEFVEDIKIIKNSEAVKPKSSNTERVNVEKNEEKIANSELDKVKLHFEGKTAVEDSLSTKTKNILKEVGIKSKNYNIYITSTARSTYDQARIMYDNCSKRGGVKEQKRIYADPGDIVVDVYVKGIKLGNSKADIIAAMENKIKALDPSTVSKHIANFKVLNTFDISYGRLSNKNDFLDEINKRKELDKVLVENDCYHVQIKQ